MEKTFNKQISSFLENLQKILPNERDIKVFQAQLDTALMITPKIVLSSFIEHVYPHKAEILAKNEKFFLEEGNVDIEEDYLSHAIHLKSLWQNKLTKENKEVVWKYLQVLVVLAEKTMK